MVINDGKGTIAVPDRGFTLWIVSVVMVIVAGLFVIARLAARFTKNRYGYDDYTIVAALVASIGLSITENMAVVHGYGRHAKSLTHSETIHALKWFYAAQILYKVVVALYRISFLCLYLRIFLDKSFRLLCKVGIAFTALCNTSFIIATVFQCLPVTAIWDKTVKHPKCINSEAFWFSYAMINIVSDVAILALPIRQIFKLQLSWKDKLGLVGVFLMGSFVCATTIVRTTTLARSSKAGDPTWAPLPATVWSVVEANTGIICACLPMIKGLVFSIFPALSTRSRTDAYGTALTEKSKSHHRYGPRKQDAYSYGSNVDDRSYQPWTMQTAPSTTTHNSHVVVSGGGRRQQDSPPAGRASQEEILGRGRIMKTVELSVTDHSDQDSLERAGMR